MNRIIMFIMVGALLMTSGCSTVRKVQYQTMEKFGVHKRDILVDRVEDARDAQRDASDSIQDAYKRFAGLVDFKGGDLESVYNRLKKSVERSESQAKNIDNRIKAVETVSSDLFREWKGELGQYSNAQLKANSERQLKETQARYKQMMGAMKQARGKIDPVLAVLQDHTLYLKHNLNARAVGALKTEAGNVQRQVADLVKEMESAIADAEGFIKSMDR